MSKVKLLFFAPNLKGGGAERVMVNIIRQLSDRKFDLTLVLVNKEGQLIELVPEHVSIIDLNVKKTIFSIFRLRNVILSLKPDILFSTLYRTHIASYMALLGVKLRPLLILRSPNSPLIFFQNKPNFFYKCFVRLAYEKANIIIAQTPEMKSDICIFFGINKMKVRVVLNPIDKRLIKDKITNIKSPFTNDTFNVVASGRLVNEKGFDFLIKGFKKVIEYQDSFRLYIIGEDVIGEKKVLTKLIKELNLQEFVFILGFQNNPYKFYFYSDLFVLSSIAEGLPNALLENLYLKKPVVSTRCLAFVDSLIIDKKNGFLIDYGDEMSLKNAILNFKKLDVYSETTKFNQLQMDDFFLETLIVE